MTFNTTPEQNAIIAWRGKQLVVNAFAGTGKTTTLVQFVQANPESKMLYLAYNRAIRDEAEQKFPFNVECKTSHQLAWSHFGRHFRHQLTANLRITDVARKLNTRHWPLARLALTGLNTFLCSAEPEPGIIHLPAEDERHGLSADEILGVVQVLWYEVSRTESDFPITHDVYLKLFQLSGPSLASKWDTILFDEAQDANPVTSAFVLSQPCRIVLVGAALSASLQEKKVFWVGALKGTKLKNWKIFTGSLPICLNGCCPPASVRITGTLRNIAPLRRRHRMWR